MERSIFTKIDFKILEIMNLIEHEPGFPILSKDLDNFVDKSQENAKLYDIYYELAKLRNI